MLSWLIWKDPDAGKDWGQEEKGTTEDEMVAWHHRLDGHGFGWTLGVGDGQGGLGCCGSWSHKETDWTEWLNWTELGHGLFKVILFTTFSFLAPRSKLCHTVHRIWLTPSFLYLYMYLSTSPFSLSTSLPSFLSSLSLLFFLPLNTKGHTEHAYIIAILFLRKLIFAKT